MDYHNQKQLKFVYRDWKLFCWRFNVELIYEAAHIPVV